MASPYLCNMLNSFQSPLYYADGIKYGVPWFANNIEKMFFPINIKDLHWVLGELHKMSGVITIYDSLGNLKNGTKYYLAWELLMVNLQYQFPEYLKSAGVFQKRNIDPFHYAITFEFADGVPQQTTIYVDCGLWVCIFLYKLFHKIPLEVDDSDSFALAYRERFIKFFWKYKIICPKVIDDDENDD